MQADAIVRGTRAVAIVSDFAAAEFASAVARKVRTGLLTELEARAALSDFDVWTGRGADRAETQSADIVAATAFLRRLDLPLRAPDAINIAIALRLAAALGTLDKQMGANAAALGVADPRF